MSAPSGIVVGTGGAPASGRRTLAELVDELARTVNSNDNKIRALAGDSVRAAVRRINSKGCWPWEYSEEEITLTPSNKFASVQSSIKKPLSMHYLTASGGNEREPLAFESYDRFLECYSLDIAGRAHTYTIPNLFETGQIRFFPIPTSADVASFKFYRITPAPRSESETVEMPDYASEMYMAFAWEEYQKRLPKGQRTMDIPVAMAASREAFRAMSAHVASPGDRSRQVNTWNG